MWDLVVRQPRLRPQSRERPRVRPLQCSLSYLFSCRGVVTTHFGATSPEDERTDAFNCQGLEEHPRGQLALQKDVEEKAKIGEKDDRGGIKRRSEEHTSELQSLMRISYAVFCLKKKTNQY